jgi:hypothetical protein
MPRPARPNEVFTSLSALSRYGRRVSAQRAQSVVAEDHRSIIPKLPGIPWWAAVVVAVTHTALGFAFDAGSGKELTTAFSVLYVTGCVVAVLAVRQSGVFSTVIQPPLILFCAVPGAYWLFHGAKFTGMRDLVINCGYPLIERFPLMLFTSAGVLLIGIIRWYLGRAAGSAATVTAEAQAASGDGQLTAPAGRLASILKIVSAIAKGDDATDKAAKRSSARAHAVGRSARSAKSSKSTDRRRAAKRPATARSRHIRPPLDDAPEPNLEAARRRRSTRTREFEAPAEPARRSRLPRDPDLRGRPPREIRRDPHARKGRPVGRGSRFDPYEPTEPYEQPTPVEPRRWSAPNGASGSTAMHHPISRVRYRTSADDDPRNEPASRPRRPHRPAADSWEYDV